MMRKCITADAIRKYAAASQDLAAIHLDRVAAAEAGFKRPIAHGMYLMGLAQSLYIAEHRTQWITQYEMKFHQPVEVDHAVMFDFTNDGCDVKVTLTTEAGEVIASGAFSVKEV
ncbi:bifunctional aldehyde dehydrogenase/enoyl-CoA hydratase [compost metagenome]